MKVKEELSNEYKKGKEVVLNQSKEYDLILKEEIFREGDLPYSNFSLESFDGLIYLFLQVPDPRQDSFSRTLFLGYQGGFKTFVKNLFLVLTKEKENFLGYTTKQDKVLTYTQDEGIIFLYTQKDSKIYHKIGFINIKSSDVSLEIGKNFIKFFEGEKINKTWKEICEE